MSAPEVLQSAQLCLHQLTMLLRPSQRRIHKGCEPCTTRQRTVQRCLNQLGRQEGERDHHGNVPLAAALARRDRVRAADATIDNLGQPPSSQRHSSDQRGSSLGPERARGVEATVVWLDHFSARRRGSGPWNADHGASAELICSVFICIARFCPRSAPVRVTGP